MVLSAEFMRRADERERMAKSSNVAIGRHCHGGVPALKQATSDVPIVFALAPDLTAIGLVASLSRTRWRNGEPERRRS
jgi:hypothetical protein